MKCVKSPKEQCPLILNDYRKSATCLLQAIDVIAPIVRAMTCWTGSEDCDHCDALAISDALKIIKALRKSGIELVPVVTNKM